jgi:hypothetical protein
MIIMGTSVGDCPNCNEGEHFDESSKECIECAEGSYQSLTTVLKHPEKCALCPSYTHDTARPRSTSAVRSNNVDACVCAPAFQRDLVNGICVCGKGSLFKPENNNCKNAPSNSYQPEDHATTSLPCPDLAQSSEKSTSQADCLCVGALRKIGDGSDSFPFICVCSDG